MKAGVGERQQVHAQHDPDAFGRDDADEGLVQDRVDQHAAGDMRHHEAEGQQQYGDRFGPAEQRKTRPH
jgi:hypothetical protein